MTGTISDVAVSLIELVHPQETFAFALSGAAGYVFNGTIALEVSRDGGQTWQSAVATDATVLRYAGEQAADFAVSKTVKNETTEPERYRVNCSVFDALSDDIVYLTTATDRDVVETLLSDRRGRPILFIRDDGSVGGDLAPSSVALAQGVIERVLTGVISAANIIGTSAGQFGHAEGVPLVEVPAGYRVELVSLVAFFDRDTAAYTAGGNITVNARGGSALTGLVSAANSLGAASDAIYVFYPLTTAAVAMPDGVNLVTTAAFTNPGTAAGVIRWKLRYRVVTLA